MMRTVSACLLAAGVISCGDPGEPLVPLVPVDRIEIGAPSTANTLLLGESAQLSAAVLDASGDTLGGRAVAWTSADAVVATVDDNGLVTAVGLGAAIIAASSEGKVDTVTVTVGVVFDQIAVSDGASHTCGRTSLGDLYCWGYNSLGQTGSGSFNTTPAQRPERVSNQPANALHPGSEHSCITTPTNALRCWGRNQEGQLGAGLPPSSSVICGFIYCSTAPVTVVGNPGFTRVSSGASHVCGLAAGSVYCWGWNRFGQIGNGDPLVDVGIPVAIASGMTFTDIDAGSWNTCAIETGGALSCWGYNESGAVGDSTTTERDIPALVHGGISFTRVSVGYRHACGIATNGDAYCWGSNEYEQLGDPNISNQECSISGFPLNCLTFPHLVAGGLTFVEISAGVNHTCGIIAGGQAYCWGLNASGQLGTGQPDFTSGVPVPVAGGHPFSAISAGNEYTCGIAQETTARGNTVAYCWGWNGFGQLGSPSAPGWTPAKVSYQF